MGWCNPTQGTKKPSSVNAHAQKVILGLSFFGHEVCLFAKSHRTKRKSSLIGGTCAIIKIVLLGAKLAKYIRG